MANRSIVLISIIFLVSGCSQLLNLAGDSNEARIARTLSEVTTNGNVKRLSQPYTKILSGAVQCKQLEDSCSSSRFESWTNSKKILRCSCKR